MKKIHPHVHLFLGIIIGICFILVGCNNTVSNPVGDDNVISDNDNGDNDNGDSNIGDSDNGDADDPGYTPTAQELFCEDSLCSFNFSGISIQLSGQEGIDFVVERLYHDTLSDNRAILYLTSSQSIELLHNQHNVVGSDTLWETGMHPGTIVYKVDGDNLRGYSENIYHAAPANGLTIDAPLNEIQFQYSQPFTLFTFKGQVGEGDDFYRGIIGPAGDEWHILTYWDVDPENSEGQRDDQTNDGSLVPVILDPATPAINFDANSDGSFYTTPAKLYYTPVIRDQITYVTENVALRLYNLVNTETIYYRINDGPPHAYAEPLQTQTLFSQTDSIYEFHFWIGSDGPQKTRLIHYKPSQPAQHEEHPHLLFSGSDALTQAQTTVAEGGSAAQDLLDPPGYIAMPSPEVDCHTGLRYIRTDLFNSGYYYFSKNLAAVIKEYARLGILQQDEQLMRLAVNGLLYFYTIAPLGCESSDGRYGGPSQERCMYSDGRILTNVAIAYDLLATAFTPQAGYTTGMTAIEHYKIRDSLASEAAILMKYPESNATTFWQTTIGSGSVRNIQLESYLASLAMAIPSYNSSLYGASGADGVTVAIYEDAPLPDVAISWTELDNSGLVINPHDSSQFRYSAINLVYDTDGNYHGQPRDGYIDMMHQDIIPYLIYRHNFDGYHYSRLENSFRLRILQRYPFNGRVMPQGFYSDGYPSDVQFLEDIVLDGFSDAPLYRWALDNPVAITDAEPADTTISSIAATTHSFVGNSIAVFSSDLADPNAIILRMRVFPPFFWNGSGTFQSYLAGTFNIAGYGARLAIEKAGYHHVSDFDYGASTIRKNTIMIDGENDYSENQPRGTFYSALLSGTLDYAAMSISLSDSPSTSSYVEQQVDHKRHVFFVDRVLFIVIDELDAASGSHQFDWLLHGSMGDGGTYVQNPSTRTAIWTKAEGQKLFAWIYPGADFNSEPLFEVDYIDYNDDDGFSEPYLRARQNGQHVYYLAALIPLDNGMSEPTVTELSVTGANGIRITGGPLTGEISIAVSTDDNAITANPEFEANCDGTICLYKTNAGQVEYLSVIEGTHITLNDYSVSLDLSETGTAVKIINGLSDIVYTATNPSE